MSLASLTLATRTADGRRCMMESDVLDICRRVTEGDPSVGWAGDPDLWVELDQATNTFVVCRYDPRTGGPMDVTRWSPPLTAGLLIRLRDADTRRPGNDPLARMDAENEALERDLDRRLAEQTFEAADRLTFEMHKAGADVPRNVRTSFTGTGLGDEGQS